MKYVLPVTALALALLLGGVLAWYFLAGGGAPAMSTRPGADADLGDGQSDSVAWSGPVALGWLAPANGVIEVAGTPGDQVEQVLVREGQVVRAGDPLAYLKSRRLRQIEVDAAKRQLAEMEAQRAAGVKVAEAQIRAAELSLEKAKLQKLDVASLEKRIALAEANLQFARSEYTRLYNLRQRALAANRADQLVSEQQLERQRLLAEQAAVELATAKTDLDKLKQGMVLAADAAQADLDAAQAAKAQAIASTPVESLKLKLDLAQAQLAQSEVTAPSKGTVLKVFLEPGESIGPKPILQMGDLDEMVVVTEVYETDAKRVREGQPAVAKSEAFPRPFDTRGLRGKVVRIGRLISTPELKSLDPFAKTDRHVIPVWIRLDAEGARQAANFVNLQVEVTFLPVQGKQ